MPDTKLFEKYAEIFLNLPSSHLGYGRQKPDVHTIVFFDHLPASYTCKADSIFKLRRMEDGNASISSQDPQRFGDPTPELCQGSLHLQMQ